MTNLHKSGFALAGSILMEMFVSHSIDRVIMRKMEKEGVWKRERKRPSLQKHNNFPSNSELAPVFPTAQAQFNLNIKGSLALFWQSRENSNGRMGLIIQESFG